MVQEQWLKMKFLLCYKFDGGGGVYRGDFSCWGGGGQGRANFQPVGMRGQLVYAMFITNNHSSFHFWWKKNLVKNQNFSKYYDQDSSSSWI